MRYLVVYSSITGNTRRVAEAVFETLPELKAIYPVEAAPDPEGYDFIALGFWLDRGTADEKFRRYIKKIKNKKIGLSGHPASILIPPMPARPSRMSKACWLKIISWAASCVRAKLTTLLPGNWMISHRNQETSRLSAEAARKRLKIIRIRWT